MGIRPLSENGRGIRSRIKQKTTFLFYFFFWLIKMSIRARDKTPAREEIEQKLVSERDFLKQLLLQVGERLEEVEKQITLVVRSLAR